MPFTPPLSVCIVPLTRRLLPAQNEGRTIVTADLDYPRLLAIARSSEPSLILFRSGNWTEAAVRARLSDTFAALSEAEIEQSIIVVDIDRVRRRRLPLGE
jgi:predicted nuclease of predicted toxin-antitoxin system